jgi:hypothetical protein
MVQDAIAEALEDVGAQAAGGWFTPRGYLAAEPNGSDIEASMAQSL